ncbi:hypothetical protein [Synechococcus sp. BA-132 BA5]|uniref:hypothetical protein n=1 Tax=Synechococcus sp. BA-132 BA5 TaxID=3110252 RepID=UPI002B21E8D4|nr:hypothetical protein [Synechococcus sp. BA-132 BA5]MEA5414876.1 hypothetical protein [Synechococcus sp. BA-132 BA5]
MAAGATLLFSSPAQAALPTCAVQVGETIFDSGGYTCQIGDKIYSAFTKTGGSASFSNAVWSFSNTEPNHTLNVSSAGVAFGPGSYGYTYRIAIAPEELATRFFESIRTGATTSGQGTNTYTKTLSSVPFTIPSPVTATQSAVNSAIGVYTPLTIQLADFTSTLVVDAGQVDQFTDSLTQNARPGESVPGPLPVLGAAAAFGFSRKLRIRIKQSV